MLAPQRSAKRRTGETRDGRIPADVMSIPAAAAVAIARYASVSKKNWVIARRARIDLRFRCPRAATPPTPDDLRIRATKCEGRDARDPHETEACANGESACPRRAIPSGKSPRSHECGCRAPIVPAIRTCRRRPDARQGGARIDRFTQQPHDASGSRPRDHPRVGQRTRTSAAGARAARSRPTAAAMAARKNSERHATSNVVILAGRTSHLRTSAKRDTISLSRTG